MSETLIAATPASIAGVRMITLKQALRLEIAGMKRHGESAYSIIKREFNLKGNKKKVFKAFEKLVEEKLGKLT